MKRLRLNLILKLSTLAIIAIVGSSCGSNNTPSVSNCSGSKAILQVYDTYIRRVCGCQEGQGNFTTGLQCTIPVGTSVYFYYPNINIPHQIVLSAGATGAPLYRDPSTANSSTFVDVVLMNTTGAITFTDSQTANGGTFTVQ